MTRADHMAQMENVFGIFVQHQNDMETAGVLPLLTEDAVLEMQDIGLRSEGAEAVCRDLQEYFEKEKAAGHRMYHIPHSLCAKLEENEKQGQAYAETHSYLADRTDGTVRVFCMRYDMDLAFTESSWKITALRWYALQYFAALPGSAGEMTIYDQPAFRLFEAQAAGRDHIAIQNLMGAWCIRNRRGAAGLFVKSGDGTIRIPALAEGTAASALEQIEAAERSNLNCYLAVPFLGAPVIDVQNDRAEGWWMSHTYQLQSSLFGKEGKEVTIRKIERIHCRFVREDGNWKILSLEVIPLAQFPPIAIDRGIHGQTPVWDGQDHWPEPPSYETENCADQYPEDVYALQRIFPEWGLRLRRAEMQKTPDLIFISDQDRVDIDINIRRNIGISNNLSRLKEFDDNCRPHETTSHNTSSPYFYINETCDRAEISWLDEGWTNMNAVFKRTDDPVHFMLNLGEYRFTYEKEADGEWKVQRIWWRVLYRLPDMQMDKEPPCFCNRDKDHIWPMPFETVRY